MGKIKFKKPDIKGCFGKLKSLKWADMKNGIRAMKKRQAEKEAAYRNADEAYERTRELLALEDRPTCILYQDDFASFGGIKAIRQAGLKIPQDISVAGYDGIRIAYQLEPQLTTLKQDTDSIGRLAAEQLISLIEEPKTTLIRPYIVEGYVEKGQSVRDINHT